jgi:GNAT superfamily N-acetyltransferase
MRLPADRIEEFARVMGRPRWAETIPPEEYQRCRVVLQDNRIVAATFITETGTDWYLMTPQGDRHFFPSLLSDVADYALAHDITRLHVRFDERLVDDRLITILELAGYQQTEHRIRYRLDLAGRSPEEFAGPSPIEWKNLEQIDLRHAAHIMGQVAEGDPGHDPGEDPLLVLNGYLEDPVLNRGPERVQVGYIDGSPVAFLCTQVNPKSGWGRITYLGVLPDWRGRGLGRDVHRHGIASLIRQGCRLYEGGTEIENRGMQKIFEANGCDQFEGERGFTWKGQVY